MLWFSHQQAVLLHYWVVLKVYWIPQKRKKRCKNNQPGQLELCIAKRAWTILFFMPLCFLFHVSEVIDMMEFCWLTGKIPVPGTYNGLYNNATCLDTRKNDLTWGCGLQFGNKVFQQQLQSLAGTENSACSDLEWNFLVASHKCCQSK